MDDAPSRVFENAGLRLVHGGINESVAVYQLGIAWVMFTSDPIPRRITISCEYGSCSENGFVSVAGFGLHWFARLDLNPEYLCEKFLRRKWTESAAADWALARAMDLFDEFGPALDQDPLPWVKQCFCCIDEAIRDYEAAVEREDGSSQFATEASFMNWHCRVFQGREDTPYNAGIAYDPNDKAWLVAIQRAFSRLFYESDSRAA